MRRSIATLLLVSACSLQANGLGSASDSNPSPSSSGEVIHTTDPLRSTSTVTGVPPLDDTGSSTSSASTSSDGPSTSSSGTSDTTGERPPLLASCAEILAADPAASTGTYAIARADNGMAIDVHCEMDLDDGGWTLIARSEAGANDQDFGWRQSAGTLGDGNNPYSLNVAQVGPAFTEILIARRMGFANPVSNAYVVEVPAGFVDDFSDSQLEHMSTRTVLGDCEPDPPPTMLDRIGYTDNTNFFYIRDVSSNQGFGLFFDGFRLNYNDCEDGADLNEDQGALFVR